jgi:hypothetical protein
MVEKRGKKTYFFSVAVVASLNICGLYLPLRFCMGGPFGQGVAL